MSRQDEKKLYEQQEEKILAQSDAFISLLTKRGILADQKIDSEKVRSAKQEKTRNSYHNTLMLLQQYRTIVWMMECFPETIAEELEKPFEGVDALIEHMDVEMAMGNRKLENRMDGIQKSRLLLDRVNEALTVLKKKPENGEKLYQLVYLTYISPEHLNHTELLYRLVFQALLPTPPTGNHHSVHPVMGGSGKGCGFLAGDADAYGGIGMKMKWQ